MLRCPQCGSTKIREITAYGQAALECEVCNHWGTLDWGFKQTQKPETQK